MKRILVIGLSNVGDAVLMSPVIASLRARFPNAELTLVAGERARLIFEHDPRITRLIGFEEYRGALGRLRLAGLVWSIRPDALIDLRQTALPLIWRPWRAWRYFRPAPRSIPHMRERHLWRMRQQLGVTGPAASPVPPALWVSPESAAYADKLLLRWGVRSGALVIVCPGARSHIKRWSAERFAQLADRLTGAYHCQVVLTGSPADLALVDTIAKNMITESIRIDGHTTFRQMAACVEQADLVIANDTGILHIAAALRRPLIGLYGPTSPSITGPLGDEQQTIVIHHPACCPAIPCLQPNHPSFPGMDAITVEEVCDAAVTVLQERFDLGRSS